MANEFFKFKQFTIHQDRCAMKVTTLACIQGAWLPDFSPANILDIGAGTGLLSLMMAQKYSGQIDAVEMEPEAFAQLRENIAQSPWLRRISCFNEDIRLFAKNNSKQYDFIICNPPFYENQLKSANPKINTAKHELSLTLPELMDVLDSLLLNIGKVSILLPPAQSQKLIKLCIQKPLSISSQLVISDSLGKIPNGIVTILTRSATKISTRKIIIKKKNGQYSSQFISLLKDYYLNLC